MIKLTNILSEQSANPLQVLFVTNANTNATGYYAKRVLAHRDISGKIVTADSNDINSLIKAVSRSITTEYQTLIIQYSGLEKTALNKAIAGLQRISAIATRFNIPVAFVDNPVSRGDSEFNQLDAWLAKSGLRFIRVGDLTPKDYLTRSGKDVNRAGNSVLYRNILRYLKSMRPDLDIEQPKSDSETVKDVPTTDKMTKVNGVIALPAQYRKRTGETTDWEAVMDFFIDKGMSKPGAAGIAGNMKIESNFKPDVYGDKGTSIGLAQWHNTRMTGLFKFAKDKKLDAFAVDTQLEWCWQELNTSFKPLLKNLMSATDARKAAEEFARQYERPAVISPKRMDYAAQYAEEYSSIENTIKRGAETVIGSVSGGLSKLGALAGAAVAAVAPISLKTVTGKLSDSQLKSIGNGHKLTPAAADAFLEMKAAYEAANPGKTIKVSDSYRSYEVQNAIFDWDLYNSTGKKRKKGTNGTWAAAYPGTSNHGRGLSLDLGPAEAQKWIRDNGEAYGWSWAEGRSVGEPWHFTYVK
jgi:hypothetical protein